MVAINIPADGLSLAVYKEIGSNYTEAACKKAVEKYIGKHLAAKPDIIILNICYRRSLTPSEVFDSVLYNIETDENGQAVLDRDGKTVKSQSPENKQEVTHYFQSFFLLYRELLKRNIDIIGMAAQEIRKGGCRVWMSFRMNDHHYLENPALNSSFAAKEGVTLKNGSYNYTKDAVQNYYFEYIREQASRYDIDGVELDWLRTHGLLPEKASDYCDVLTGFNLKVRKMLDGLTAEKGKRLSLGVRVLPDEAQTKGNGMDIPAWVASGAVDTVTVSNFFMPTNYEIPIDYWRNAIKAKNTENHLYTLLCGSDWGVFCKPKLNTYMTPAMVRGLVTSNLGRGADGVYLFNFFEEGSNTSQEFYIENGEGKLRDCFIERMKAATEPVNSLPRRHIHIGTEPDRYPIEVTPGSSYCFDIYTGSIPEIYRLLIGTAEKPEIEITVNGESLTAPLTAEKQYAGFEYGAGMSFNENGMLKDDVTVYAPCQLAPSVSYISIPTGALKDGYNSIEIKNTGDSTLEIDWLEVICE